MTPSSDSQMESRRVLSNQQRKSSHAACVNCHSRKVRCDAPKRGFPCSNCISSRRPHCRVHEKKKRTPQRPVENPVPIRPQTQGNHLENSGSITGVASSIHCATSSSLSSPVPEANATPGSAATESDRGGFRRHLVEFLDQADIGHRSIQKGVRITYVGKDVSNINFLVRQREGREDETVHHFPSDEIARQYITHEPERMPREAFILPEKAVADELVEAYFTNINPGCPIVDEDIFMAQYKNKNPSDPPSLLVLQAILLVGAHVSRHRPDRETLKATFFRRAKMLFDARLEKNRDVVVQAALLLTWHSDGAEDIGAGAWYWTGIAARIATGLGMHRDAGSSTLINHDLRTWRRTWWILVQFDVMVSLSHGRPQAINLDECDVKSLTASDFQGCGPRVNIDFVVKYTELCLLISKALKERFGLRVSREERKAALGNADEALANWCLSLPPSLQMRSSDMDVWSATLHLSYNNFLILLHRPHPKASQRSNDYGPNDGDICSSAANTVATIFEDLREKDRIKYLWISDVNALFTAMIQVSVELRFSNPVLAINALRRFDSTLCSLRKLAEYWINAESILRIFEESSQIQHVVRLGKGAKNCGDLQLARERPESRSGSRNQQRTAMLNQPTSRFDSAPTALQTHSAQTWAVEEQSDLDVLAAAANAASDLSSGQMQQSQAGDQQNDWGHFTSTNISEPSQILLSPDIMQLDNEWREIYWQEPGIPGSFGDGLFGW